MAGSGEIARDEWMAYFDSAGYSGFDVTVEVVDAEYGDEYEAERLPLRSISYDPKDDALIVTVGGWDGRYPILRHIIEQPQRVSVDQAPPDLPLAIDVEAKDGSRTILSLFQPQEASSAAPGQSSCW